ncbi:hypothetical protein Tco_0008952 [Tanacetum coccineum]
MASEVYEVVLEKDSEIYKSKKENYKSLTLKARKSQVMKKDLVRIAMMKSMPWRDSEEDTKKDKICLMANDTNEVLSDTPYYSSSSLDNESLQNEYDKLCKISLRIINKNKHLKAKNEVLKNETCDLRKRVEQLERNKEICRECESCVNLQSKVRSLTLKLASFESSSIFLQEMLEKQKTQKDKHGIGFIEDTTSTSNTKTKKSGPVDKEMSTIELALPVSSARESTSSFKQNRLSEENVETLESNIVKKNSFIQITRKPLSNTSVKNVKQAPILKLSQGLGKSKIQTHPKTLHRRTNALYPKSDYHQVGWDYSTQQGYQFQTPNFGPWGSCPPYPYMNQPNGVYNANGPMRYWGPNA